MIFGLFGLGRRSWTFSLRATLLALPFLDELISGFPVVALPLVRDDLGLSYAQAGLIFTVGELAAMVLEPGINLLGDRRSKRGLVVSGLFGLALAFALAGSASSFVWLLLGLALSYPAGGAAIGLAQATLVDQSPETAPRTLTRWTALAAVGDLLSPLAVAAVVALGFGWRFLFWGAAALWLGAALITYRQRFPNAPVSGGEHEESHWRDLFTHLREALRLPGLLRWLIVLLFADMLDEIFLAFAALFLRDIVRADGAAMSLALSAQMVGAMLGLVVLDRLLGRISPEQLLRGLSLLTLAGIAVLLGARSVWPAAGALFLIGFGAAGWYPIAKAAAYATVPGRTGTVLAVIGLTAPFRVAIPVLIGLVAEQFGLIAGIAVLGSASLGVFLLASR